MSRMSPEHRDATSYIYGSWNLWSKDSNNFAGRLEFAEGNSSYLEYSNGWSSWWNYDIQGHEISGSVPGQPGRASVKFSSDGTVGVASIGHSLFDVWREADAMSQTRTLVN